MVLIKETDGFSMFVWTAALNFEAVHVISKGSFTVVIHTDMSTHTYVPLICCATTLQPYSWMSAMQKVQEMHNYS